MGKSRVALSAFLIEHLSFSYGRRRVLSDVNWDVPSGITGLIGPNGAGKTTLIRCLAELARPSSGSITIRTDGRGDSKGRRRVGYVPQNSQAPGRMKVSDIIEYCAWLNGVPNSLCQDEAKQAIKLLDLGPLSSRRFGSLSGGERRRVMIGAGIAHHPQVLILDEPTVGLDPGQRLTVRRAIASLTGLHNVLLATHLVEDVEHLCTNVAILNRACITYAGTTAGLLQHVKSRNDSIDQGRLAAIHKPGDSSQEKLFGSPFEQAYEDLLNWSPTPPTPTTKD